MKILNIPNALVMLRILLVPFIVAFLYSERSALLAASLILFIIAALTDFIDGYIARKHNMETTFGTVFDPIADKFLVLALFFALAGLKLIPLWVALFLLFRELCITGIRQAGALKKKLVGANIMGKVKASLQMGTIVLAQAYLLSKSVNAAVEWMPSVIYYASIGVALLSAVFLLIFLNWNKKVFS